MARRHSDMSAAGCGMWVLIILALAASVELIMGRRLICSCGTVHFWVGNIHSGELSQQIADWYSFSHVIHGFALYGFLYLGSRGLVRRDASSTRRPWPLRWRLVLATLIEACWEMLENSPLIIARYRQTAAQGYTGDTVLNSMSDISFCLLGFALASRLPVWAILALTVLMEVGVGYRIHDNLALNVIMLIHPFAAIRRWQMAG